MKKLLLLAAAFLLADPALADPISAGFAIASIYAGATAAAVTVGEMVVAGMLVAGGAMSLIGNMSGDRKLQKYGGLLSMAGGVAGMANGAWDSAAQDIAGKSASTAGDAGSATTGGAGSTVEGTAGATPGNGVAAPPDTGVAAGAPATGSAAPPASSLVDSNTAAFNTANGVPDASVAGPTGATPPSANLSPDGPPTGVEGNPGSTGMGARAARAADTSALPPSNVGPGKNLSADVGQFIRDNRELVQLGTGIVNGSLSRSAEFARQRAEMDYLNQRRADYNAGITGSAPIPIRPSGITLGIINRNIPQGG